MGLFDFVVNNADLLEKLYANPKGEIDLDLDDFDFSHSDLQVKIDGARLLFSVEVGNLKLMTSVDIDNLADAVKAIRAISDVDLRVTVLETIEDAYRDDAKVAIDLAEQNLSDAQSRHDAAKKDLDMIVDSINDLKGAWNIP